MLIDIFWWEQDIACRVKSFCHTVAVEGGGILQDVLDTRPPVENADLVPLASIFLGSVWQLKEQRNENPGD